MRTRLTGFVFLLAALTLMLIAPKEVSAQFSGKVLFVTVTATAKDTLMRTHLTDWGFSVDVMDIATFKAAVPADTTLAKYKFVYVSEAPKSADLAGMRGLNAPILSHKSYMAPKGVAGYCAGAAANVTTNGNIEIIDSTNHMLAAGFAKGAAVTLVTGTGGTKYINYFPADALVPMIPIAKVAGDATNSQLVVVGIEKGTNVYATSAETTPSLSLKQRVAIIGINSEANAYYTEDAWKLAKAGAQWLLEGTAAVEKTDAKVSGYQLEQNYPNPFNPSTTISFDLKVAGPVALTVYNTLGKEVATLVNGEKPAGNYKVDFSGAGLSSGIYFYQLKTANFSQVKKMILMK